MVWNWLRRHPVLVDALLTLAVGAIYVADAVYHHRYVLGLALALIQALALLVRRRWPLAVLAVVTLGALGTAIAYRTVVPLAGAVAVYTVAVYETRRRSGWATAGALAAMVAATVRSTDYASLVFFVAAWILGENLRTRRAYLNELEEKADRLEREREANIQRAAAEEQARIARELHDVIAHNVSVMTVQAAAAGDVFRIAVTNGQVQYMKNHVVFYVSATPPQGLPLNAKATLWSFGATVRNAVIMSGG